MPLPAAERDANHVMIIKLLAEANADLNVATSMSAHLDGTPVMVAASKGRTSVVIAMLENGADIGARDADGLTVLDWAIDGHYNGKIGHEDTARAIQDFKACALATELRNMQTNAGDSNGLAWHRVRLLGLRAKPELNGLCGSAGKYESSSGRILVVLDKAYGDIRCNQGKPGAAIKVRLENLELISPAPPASASGTPILFETSDSRAKAARRAFNRFQEEMLPMMVVMAWPDQWPAPPGNTTMMAIAPRMLPICQEMPAGQSVPEVELVHQLWFYRASLIDADAVVISEEALTPRKTVRVVFGQLGDAPTETVELAKPGMYDHELKRDAPSSTDGGFTRAELAASIAIHLQLCYDMKEEHTEAGLGNMSFAEAKVRHPPGGGPPLTRLKLKSVIPNAATGVYHLEVCVDAVDKFESGGGGWDMCYGMDE